MIVINYFNTSRDGKIILVIALKNGAIRVCEHIYKN